MGDSSRNCFPHERLDAYHAAQDLVEGCVEITASVPRGYADVRDQARRAALSTVRHIAEGASRLTHADKRARFAIARGEVAELHATLVSAARCRLVDPAAAQRLQVLANRVGAMLTGLMRRESRAAARPTRDRTSLPDPTDRR
jgi:four helix bundle protein